MIEPWAEALPGALGRETTRSRLLLEGQFMTESPQRAAVREPDAHGQAALLLAESILHALVDASSLSNGEAIAAALGAAQVNAEFADAAGESHERMEAIDLLERIAASFAVDVAAGIAVKPKLV